MKSKIQILLFIFTTLLFLSCEEKENLNINKCNECVVISKDLYNKTTTNNYTINNVTLVGDLLTVKIGASGCNGESWKATLIDANQLLESYPIQRNVKILFENDEDCLAVFEKEFTFYIKELKENQSEAVLNLEGWDSQINYK